VLGKEMSLLKVRLAMAQQEAIRLFQELQEKVRKADRATEKAARHPGSWRMTLDALEAIDDCSVLMEEVRALRMVGDTAWERGDKLLESVPDDASIFS